MFSLLDFIFQLYKLNRIFSLISNYIMLLTEQWLPFQPNDLFCQWQLNPQRWFLSNIWDSYFFIAHQTFCYSQPNFLRKMYFIRQNQKSSNYNVNMLATCQLPTLHFIIIVGLCTYRLKTKHCVNLVLLSSLFLGAIFPGSDKP